MPMERHSYKGNKAARVLEFISMSREGRSLKEIQTFILDMNGREKWIKKGYLRFNPMTGVLERTYKGRGYWCDYLYGTSYYRWSEAGFLYTHCIQLPSGKWIVTEEKVGPFRGKQTKSLQYNRDRARGAHERYIESLPKCKSCNEPLHKFYVTTPDLLAHFESSSSSHSVDCKGRVWRVNDMNVSFNEQKFTLTGFSKSELVAAEHMAEQLFKDNWHDAKKALWAMLGTRLA